MGKQPSLKEMEKNVDDFGAWVAQHNEDVETQCRAARDDLVKQFEDDYPDFDDWLVLRDKHYADFTETETFTLANVAQIVDTVSGALFGAPTAKEGGGDGPDNPTEAPTGQGIAQLAGMDAIEAQIAVRALSAISGILGKFDASASLDGTFQSGIEETAAGLFMGVAAQQTDFKGKKFFGGKTIKQTYFVVLIQYSHKAALATNQMENDMTNEKACDTLRTQYIENFEKHIAEVDPFTEAGQQTVEFLTSTMSKLQGQIETTLGKASKQPSTA